MSAVAFCAALFAAAGCTKDIPNTTVKDTPENREVITFMENYRNAVEARDIGALLAMASTQYLDDNGTPSGDDDLDYRALQQKLSRWRERVTDVRYEIKYRTISREMDRVLIAFRYSASFRVAYDEEDQRWSRRIGENRLVLLYDDIQARYYVLSGM
ncbi:MAG: hypothetical protein WBB42_16905 [Polyangiales bacterium]